jgi:hypothetical protein
MQMTDKCRCIGDQERGNFVPNGNISGGSVMIWVPSLCKVIQRLILLLFVFSFLILLLFVFSFLNSYISILDVFFSFLFMPFLSQHILYRYYLMLASQSYISFVILII